MGSGFTALFEALAMALCRELPVLCGDQSKVWALR